MPINYKRWDDIGDSSDEEPLAAQPASRQLPQTVHQRPPPPEPLPRPLPPPSAPPPEPVRPVDPELGRAAVCSTMKDVEGRIVSWVRWHVHLGFEKLFLFFDDAAEHRSMSLAVAAGGDRVVLLPRNSASLLDGLSRVPSWAAMGPKADADVQIRQLLNAQYAMVLTKRAGLTWLLHIDSDELFLPAPRPLASSPRAAAPPERGHAGSATAHFAALAAGGCEFFSYHNLEGVPEKLPRRSHAQADEAAAGRGLDTDPFTEITLFKQTHALIPHTQSAEAAVESWRKRNDARKFFLYYENGKAAVRVDTDGLWVPISVHACLPRIPNLGHPAAPSTWDSQRLLDRGWTNDGRNEGMRVDTTERSVVLHFPVWDHVALWRKYAMHGSFTDKLVSGLAHKGGLEWGPCFHVQCRDAYLECREEADGGLGSMTKLFTEAACLMSESEAIRQIACGVLVRLPDASIALLSSATEPPTAADVDVAPPSGAAAFGREEARVGCAQQPQQVPSSGHGHANGAGPTGHAPAPPPARAFTYTPRAAAPPDWTAAQQVETRAYNYACTCMPAHPRAPNATQVKMRETFQVSETSVERRDWRGPKPYRSRLSDSQREALRMMRGAASI